MEINKEQEKLIDNLLDGKVVLYSMSDIQKKLSISRSTLNRWINNGSKVNPSIDWLSKNIKHSLFDRAAYSASLSAFQENDEEDVSLTFPAPDLYIGNSPRWARETVKKWILDSQKNR